MLTQGPLMYLDPWNRFVHELRLKKLGLSSIQHEIRPSVLMNTESQRTQDAHFGSQSEQTIGQRALLYWYFVASSGYLYRLASH